jgi:GH15 family glucan-1,4-alpha-glucosidase
VSKPIEDYALIGDRRSAALVARNGSIDWLCWPHFDSDACFAALLGDARNGCWGLAPREMPQRTTRCYLGDTPILETTHETASGSVRVTDLMPVDTEHRAVIRQVTGLSGRVVMVCDLALRFDYGSIPPWLRTEPRAIRGVVGPDLVVFRSPVDIDCKDDRIVGEFAIEASRTLTFTLQYGMAYKPEPEPLDPAAAIAAIEGYWRDRIGKFCAQTDWPEPVRQSLITLQALTEVETGAIIAAPTMALPEVPGSVCNWDYRYTWLRDSTFALSAFLNAGYREEASCWRDWLLRTATGVPERLRTMYRNDGARHTVPHDVSRLPGWENCRPIHGTCWLADCLAMQGRDRDARRYLERVIEISNDVGLLSEEWDTRAGRMLGNFPQALSHLALINTALARCGPVLQRSAG